MRAMNGLLAFQTYRSDLPDVVQPCCGLHRIGVAGQHAVGWAVLFSIFVVSGLLAGFFAKAYGADPMIEITNAPPIGSTAPLEGQVSGVVFADCGVAVFIYVEGAGGWWNKKSFAEAITPIQSDGTWTTDISVAPADAGASRIAAFLVDGTYAVPELDGVPTFPSELLIQAKAQVTVDRARRIVFAGHEWRVKPSSAPVGPGSNLFSDSASNVWVDTQGFLHLKVTKEGTTYKCAEVMSVETFGYGSYVFQLNSPVDRIDSNLVLGLFTWSDIADDNHREIDIEYTRWGAPSNLNSQFAVQPAGLAGHIERFDTPAGVVPTVHSFKWSPDRIDFQSAVGTDPDPPSPSDIIHTWTYEGPDIPHPGPENVRINFYLISGLTPPTDGQEAEVVIRSFEFRPKGNAAMRIRHAALWFLAATVATLGSGLLLTTRVTKKS